MLAEAQRGAVCEAYEELLVRGVTADVRAIAQRHGVTVDTGCPAACAEQRARALLELAARARACGSGQRLRLCCSCELDERTA